MQSAPVPGRPPPSPAPPYSGGPTLKISEPSDTVCLVNRPLPCSGNPCFTATEIAPLSGDRPVTCDIPVDSSCQGGPSVQISEPSEFICTSDCTINFPPALFTQCSSLVSAIPAGSGIVPEKGSPICGPLCLGNHMPPSIATLDSDRSGNFRSENLGSPLLGAPIVSVNSSGFRPPISNSFLPVFPHITRNISDQSISGNMVAIGNAQIVGCGPSSQPSSGVLDVQMAESTVISTGSGLHSPSPADGHGQLSGQRVDSVGSTGQHGRVNSAAHAVRSTLPGASGAVPSRSVPPTVSFKDILGRTASSRPHQAFADVDLLPEIPASTVRDGIPGILFPDQVITDLSVPFRFTLVGRISGNRGLTPNSDILSALSCIGLLGSHTVRFIPRGYLVLTLSCEEDYLRFWDRPEVSIRSVIIRFSKWTPEFKFEEDSSIVPVWVRFPDLPLHLYAKTSLYPLAKILGNPVKIDEVTAVGSRGSFARVCVEIDVLQARPEHIWVGWGDHMQVVEVVYERVPHYCTHCKLLGHSVEFCSRSGHSSRPRRSRGRGHVAPVSTAPVSTSEPQVSVPSVPPGGIFSASPSAVPLDPVWSQVHTRRRNRRRGPISPSPKGNSFAVLQDIVFEPVSEDLSAALNYGPTGLFTAAGVEPPPVIPITSMSTSLVVSSLGSSVEVSPIQVDVIPVVPVPVDGSFVLGQVVSTPVSPSSSQSLPLPGRTRSQKRRFYRAQASQLSSPYGRPPDPG